MEDSHLSLEEWAKLKSGRMEHDELLRLVLPHLLALCPICRQREEELRRLQDEVAHWDEWVVVTEGAEAPRLAARLADRPYDEQRDLVEEDEELQAWGLCQLLLGFSRAAVFENPARAVDYATLGVLAARKLDPAYDEGWVLDLQARALAYLGNALRVLGELRSSEEAFREAESLLKASTTGNLRVSAEILDLKSSLRRAQRRLAEALELIDQALELYRGAGVAGGLAKALVSKAKILEERGAFDDAIELLRESISMIDSVADPQLSAYSRHNLLETLILAGRHEEAEHLLPQVRELFREIALPLDRVRLRWTEGLIALGLDQRGPAEEALREARREFLDREMGYDAALVSLDIAVLYAREGNAADLKQLAAEMLPIFASRDVHREALAALLLFRQACEDEQVTVELARQLAAFLRRERPQVAPA